MISYNCDGCGEAMTHKEYYKKNSYVDGKNYCNTCRPKVREIVDTLKSELETRTAEDLAWYETEKAAQIEAACTP
jgi:hypothetical protein